MPFYLEKNSLSICFTIILVAFLVQEIPLAKTALTTVKYIFYTTKTTFTIKTWLNSHLQPLTLSAYKNYSVLCLAKKTLLNFTRLGSRYDTFAFYKSWFSNPENDLSLS